MLVLSRKVNESIIINDNIRIVVVEVRGNTVRLGIEAPGDVPIYRTEVLEKYAGRERDASDDNSDASLSLSREETGFTERRASSRNDSARRYSRNPSSYDDRRDEF